MSSVEIRQKLHEFIDLIEDKKVEATYTLLEGEIEELEYSDDFKGELDKRTAYYKSGGKMVSAAEVNRKIKELLKVK